MKDLVNKMLNRFHSQDPESLRARLYKLGAVLDIEQKRINCPQLGFSLRRYSGQFTFMTQEMPEPEICPLYWTESANGFNWMVIKLEDQVRVAVTLWIDNTALYVLDLNWQPDIQRELITLAMQSRLGVLHS